MSGFYRLFSRQEQAKNDELKRERERIDREKQEQKIKEVMSSTGDLEKCLMIQINFLKKVIADMEQENKKKLDAATEELSEKAEENAVLYNKLEAANAQIKALEAENKRLKDGLVTQRTRNRSSSITGPSSPQQQQLSSVFHRLQAGAVVLGAAGSPLRTGQSSSSSLSSSATQLPRPAPETAATAVAVTTTKIASAIETAAEIRRKDEAIDALNKRLVCEENNQRSLKSSIAEYEKKIVALEKKLQDSLEKEQQKRMIAESNAKRFKQKIRNMQLIIDDLQSQIDGDGSDDDDDDDDSDGSKSSGGESSGSDDDD